MNFIWDLGFITRGEKLSYSKSQKMCDAILVTLLKMRSYPAAHRAWLAQLVERQSDVREVDSSSPRPDQHSGS